MAGPAVAAQAETLRRMERARNYNGWLFERAEPYLGARVLDVGAGIGTFSELAAASHRHVLAAEPDPAFERVLRERLRSRPNVHVFQGPVEEIRAEPFDSIVCFNVLEHIDDDRAAVARLADLLRRGGHLLLLVPAHPLLYGATDRALAHARRYRKRALDALLRDHGLDPLELRHVNPIGALGWLASSRLLRREHVPAGPLVLYDRLVPVLKALDRLRLPVGLSLWAVARRV